MTDDHWEDLSQPRPPTFRPRLDAIKRLVAAIDDAPAVHGDTAIPRACKKLEKRAITGLTTLLDDIISANATALYGGLAQGEVYLSAAESRRAKGTQDDRLRVELAEAELQVAVHEWWERVAEMDGLGRGGG